MIPLDNFFFLMTAKSQGNFKQANAMRKDITTIVSCKWILLEH